MKGILRLLSDFFDPPDPALIEAGAGGERLVAWTRLVFWFAIVLAPLVGVITRGRETAPEIFVATLGGVVAVLFSLVVVLVLRGRQASSAVGFFTGAVDLTIISVTLLVAAIYGSPDVVLHSEVGWAVILLVIMTSCLRFDTRICLFMGILAVVQYAALLFVLVGGLGVEITPHDTVIQAARIVLMLAATALAMGIVNRTRGLMRASGFDPLTGLATRAYFDQRLKSASDEAQRHATSLALVLIDLDHFKKFNDTHGHHAGDDALKHVARLIRRGLREQDFVARWGGEELALIMPGLDRDQAAERVETIAARIREAPVAVGANAAYVTISAGVAEFGIDGRDPTSVFAAADRRVFAAKDAGRDRVCSGQQRLP